MNIIYCDDEAEHGKAFLKEYKSLFPEDNAGFCRSPSEILNGNVTADILFMDIELNQNSSGIDYAIKIHEKLPDTQIIFVTAYTKKYIQEVFLTDNIACGFLTKPIERDYLKRMTENAKKALNSSYKLIYIKPIGKNPTVVNEKEICYIESTAHKVSYVTKTDAIEVYDKLNDVESALSPCFIRCHQSFIVNMNEIYSIESKFITLKDGRKIPSAIQRKTA